MISTALATCVVFAADPAPLGELVDAGGYRVHLYCTGAGSPTVVVAGGGFSFDWGLVQPEVARFTRVCTCDPSGTAWSDPPAAAPVCSQRVDELHRVLRAASVSGPYVLVGFSIGGLYARLFALRYPEDVAGLVIVDHALIDPADDTLPARQPATSPKPGVLSASQVDTPPVLISGAPINFGIEDDDNFQRLPQRDQDLHRWAMSRHPARPTAETARECMGAVAAATQHQTFPLGTIPVVVVSTANDSRAYDRLQHELLALSRNSTQIVAQHSTHMVIVDAPDVIVRAISDAVTTVRTHAPRRK